MTDIENALKQLQKVQPIRQGFVDYFDGNHKLNFATDKFRNAFGNTLQSLRDNLCPIVVESPADRMEVINFSGDDADKDIASTAWKIWQREKMELVANQTHIEAFKTGDAFVIVWPDESGKARFYPQDSRNCVIVNDTETGLPKYAAKLWKNDDGKLRLNMYYPDRTEKYGTPNKFEGGLSDLKEQTFQKLQDDPDVTNPYGVVPMFSFTTTPVLRDAVPIQDALNKTVCDKLVAMEFAAFRQRWATGIEVPEDEVTGQKGLPFKAGVDRMFYSEDKDTKFGEFGIADLEQFLKVADSYRLEMARVSGTPLHFFSINTSDAISGEALKTLESRFTKRVKRYCLSFGVTWSSAMKFALQIENVPPPDNLTVQWAQAEQRSEKEFLETLGLKRDTLDVPVNTLREEYGYSKEDITKFNEENELKFDDEPPTETAVGSIIQE